MLKNPITSNSMNLGAPEIIIIALVILLLFGGKKIPELMKGLGKGVKSYRDGLNGLTEDINKPAKEEKTTSENQ